MGLAIDEISFVSVEPLEFVSFLSPNVNVWLCVIPSSCSSVGVACVAFGKRPGVLGMGVRVPFALACCLTNGFVAAGNRGDG